MIFRPFWNTVLKRNALVDGFPHSQMEGTEPVLSVSYFMATPSGLMLNSRDYSDHANFLGRGLVDPYQLSKKQSVL
jgi:hypothetical protein